MNISQIEIGLTNFINSEIASKAPGHIKFLIYTGMSLAAPKFELMFNQYKDHPIIQALEIIEPDGDIDVDNLYTAMKEAMKKMGRVEYMGIIFTEHDVDKLYEYLKRG